MADDENSWPPAGAAGTELEAITDPAAGMGTPAAMAQVLREGERRVAALERGGRPVSTGFLVGPDLLLTSGHALASSPGGLTSVEGMTAVFDRLDSPERSPYETGSRVRLLRVLQYSPPTPGESGLTTADVDPSADQMDFALVLLADPPPDAVDDHGNSVPRGFYPLEPDAYDFRGAQPLHVFHHPIGMSLRHTLTSESIQVTAGGRRVRYRTNTMKGSSGGALVDRNGRLVAMHQSSPDRERRFSAGMNQGIPVSLIAAALLAGPHGDRLRSPGHRPAGVPRAEAAPGPVVLGAARMGATMGALLGPWSTHVLVPVQGGTYGRATTSREVVERYLPEDRLQAAGVSLVGDAARVMDVHAGDGATTAAVLAAVLIEEAGGWCARGASPAGIAREAGAAMTRARAELSGLSEPCEDARSVALTATADPELAEAVAAAAKRAGPHGVLFCEPGDSRGVETVTRPGLQIPAGYASPHTVVDPWSGRVTLADPYVLLLDAVVEDGSRLGRLLSRIDSEGRRLLILTTQNDVGLLGALRKIRPEAVPPVVQVGTGGGDRHRLRALAVLTGATILTPETGLRPETAWLDLLGRAGRAVISRNDTVLVGGWGDRAAVDWQIASTRVKRQQSSASRHAALDEMLAMLQAEAVCLRIGADTPGDLTARAGRAERAARAAQAALRSGTVAGGGLAMLRCRAALADPPGTPGAEVVRAALAAPFRQLARSAGMTEGEMESVIVNPGAFCAPDVSSGRGGLPPRDATEILDRALDSAMGALNAFVTVGHK